MPQKRSEKPFPCTDDCISGYIKTIWESGWLDEYSEEHFLIKAINHSLSDIYWTTQLLNNNSYSMYSPVNTKGMVDYDLFASVFITNLSVRLQNISNCFGEENIKTFIVGQLSAGKNNYDEDQFFQALSEIEILSFWSCRCRWDECIYEPPMGENGSNPEASFIKYFQNGRKVRINIEIKTPKFMQPMDDKRCYIIPNILLSPKGRTELNQLCVNYEIGCKMPRVTKLVEFINSAEKKFNVPCENEYNFLYINWSYSDYPSNGFLEAWSLLTNDKNGIITHSNIGTRLPFEEAIHEEAYKKISAIIVYTSSLEQLMFSNYLHVWQGTNINVGHRFRMIVLDPLVDQEELFAFSGMNPDLPSGDRFMLLINRGNKDISILNEFKNKALKIITENPLIELDL